MKIGVVGTGAIVETFLQAMSKVHGVECIALCSRKTSNRTDELSKKYNIQSMYSDYKKMLENKSIDFIYIALPNSLHYSYTLKALENKKNVICEKPFTSTIKESEHLITVAKKYNLFLFEGITTIYLPNFIDIKNKIKDLQDIKLVQCNFSQYSSRYNSFINGEISNVFNPTFSGGALYDINIYNLHFVIGLFGKPVDVRYLANTAYNGIDTSGIVILKYKDFVCECVGAKDTMSPSFVYIQGRNGYLKLNGSTNECPSFEFCIDGEVKSYNNQEDSNRMVYELNKFKEIFDNDNKDMCYKLLEHSLNVVETAVKARKDAEIVFPADNTNTI
ncbi:Gfo/Idh/MocA family protein [Clostridium taeniosporum]|uniref:Gfo/Idh/MocA family oxidoreductase n=1 Tax=Clostridium taeniosporum TaxID=394958 RepID=A0A1D7XK44_9CLOT|nr:Gfo/Idh/MocA family oxidoreductase [Clostridium taeniosporum]AOR23718.1 gfo/Idh/MocA family oxidoreductase [Clostridium taeniosporum]